MGNSFERGFGFGLGLGAARAVMPLLADPDFMGRALGTGKNTKPISREDTRTAGSETLRLVTYYQRGQDNVVIGGHLYRVVGESLEPLPFTRVYTSYEDGLTALNLWVTYFESHTIEGLRWMVWHVGWYEKIVKYFDDELLPWVKSRPDREQQCIVQMRKHASKWVGAATVAAAEMPELLEYSANCGAVLKIYIGGYTKDEVMAIVAAETVGKTPKMLARMGDDELKALFYKVTNTVPVQP
jgi:hypothetical protein